MNNKSARLTPILNKFLIPIWLFVICFSLFSLAFIMNQVTTLKKVRIQFQAQREKMKNIERRMEFSKNLYETQKASFKESEKALEELSEIPDTSPKTFIMNDKGVYIPISESEDTKESNPTRVHPSRRVGPQN